MNPDEEDFRPTPDDEQKLQVAQQVYQRMQKFTLPCITAIAKVLGEKEGEFVGSGSFMVFNGDVFLVTAEHVSRESQAKPSLAAAFSNGENKLCQKVTSKFFIDVNLDIAIAKVNLERPPASACLPCPRFLIAEQAGGLDDLLFVQGFPGEYGKFSIFGPCLVLRPLPWGSRLTKPTWEGFDPNIHFAMGFNTRYAEYADRSPATLPNPPKGMSGSMVWNTRRLEVGESWKPSDARAIGVIHRWDPDGRCLIGTRIEYVHGLVATSF